MTIKDVLNKYDALEKKRFYAHDVTSELSQVSDEDKTTLDFRYEMLAFSLVPSVNETEWGTHYGPQFYGKNSDGTPVTFPEFSSINNDAVLYWEKRAQETANPLLKMRYCGLTWDFKRIVCNDKYPNWLFDAYVQSILDVVNGDYEPHDVITVNDLESLAQLGNKSEKYKEEIKKAFTRFDDERTKDDNAARLWGALLGYVIKNKDSFTKEEENKIVLKHEERLKRLSSPSNKNPWAANEQAKILADYYKSGQKQEDVKRVLNVMESAFRNNEKDMSPMQWMSNLEQIAATYATYNLPQERLRLLKEIEKAWNNALSETILV